MCNIHIRPEICENHAIISKKECHMAVFEEESMGSGRLIRRSRPDIEYAIHNKGGPHFLIIKTNNICYILQVRQK